MSSKTYIEHLSAPIRHTAKIIHGEKVGRTIGFPTANFSNPPEDEDVKQGVYFGRCTIVGESAEETKQYDCLAYFGPRHIFGEKVNSFEVYIYDFDDQIYGKDVTVVLSHYMRPPEKINNLEQLQLLLENDKKTGEVIRSEKK